MAKYWSELWRSKMSWGVLRQRLSSFYIFIMTKINSQILSVQWQEVRHANIWWWVVSQPADTRSPYPPLPLAFFLMLRLLYLPTEIKRGEQLRILPVVNSVRGALLRPVEARGHMRSQGRHKSKHHNAVIL